MTLVNTETGEIVEISAEERSAVARLTTAIAALSEAVDFMPINEVASVKAQVATIQTATKELGMSKEAQELAAEAVRRAEWALRRAQKKAQADGEMRTSQSNLIPGGPRSGGSTTTSEAPRPRDMFTGEVEYRDALAMGELDADEFDEVIAEAKAEGNLSRANVARKAREKSGAPERAKPRKALIDTARDAGWDLRKSVERLQRIAEDDRFATNKPQVAPLLRSHLENAVEVCQDLLARIDN